MCDTNWLSLRLQFTDNTLQPLGLVFRPAFLLLHASADPPAGLSSYGGFDTYGEVHMMPSLMTAEVAHFISTECSHASD